MWIFRLGFIDQFRYSCSLSEIILFQEIFARMLYVEKVQNLDFSLCEYRFGSVMNYTFWIIWCVKEYQKPVIKVCRGPQRDISASSGYLLFWELCCFAISLLRNVSTNFQFIVWMEEFVFQAVLKHLFHSAGECSLNRQTSEQRLFPSSNFPPHLFEKTSEWISLEVTSVIK